jgi:hypothetical protein
MCLLVYLFCPRREVFEGEERLALLNVGIDSVDYLHFAL